ncbi:tyrosine-type recombinase/integrase [Massilia forsythiae]|uniref:Tyrosine-type recombinase/integrase n=1 Tax=Massilia forsythiae TaxID=2728020 RepID=A0A7Z2VX04_9BURK|nr:site-specific integrase [Massilia forsythiae]QJE00678.1 tyrosine-type recombinase/integrase [Massilia forsythiae]
MAKRGSNLLSDLQIRRWIAGGESVAKSDGDGLTFTLSAAGTATWVLRYRFANRSRELTIGNYPDIGLGAARKLASEQRVAIDKGQDPAAQKRAERQQLKAAWTVRRVITDFKEKVVDAGQLSARTRKAKHWDLDNIILPKLGPFNVQDVTPPDVVDMLDRSGRTWAMQNRFLTTAGQVFDHAIGRQLIRINPAAGIKMKALMGPRPPVRKRVMLKEGELRTLLSSVDEIGTENALALKILLATCVRTWELITARWEHVDFERGTWLIPAEKVKTRVAFLVPITPTVAAWLKELRHLAGDSEWVLPGRSSKRAGSHVGRSTLGAAISRAFERGQLDIRRFTPHDTRSTAKGHMRNLGVSREISEIALNHTLKGMEGIYDVREEIPERRQALELWAMFLATCERGEIWNVVPIGRAVA